MFPIFRYRGQPVYFVYFTPRIQNAYAVYIGAHGIAGVTFGAGIAIQAAANRKDMSYCILAPFTAFACGLFGIAAGLIPGVTPISAVAIMYKKSAEYFKSKK